MIEWILLIGVIGAIAFSGIRTLRPTQRGLVERLGKFHKFAESGFHWIIPVIDNMMVVNITEMMIDAKPQEIITSDNLNATVDAQIYFKIKPTEDDVKASQYNVSNVEWQITNLARTTLRAIIGNLPLMVANSDREKINKALENILVKETNKWGIEVVRTELKEIEPPADVQATMNEVVKADNAKVAAVDYATAEETKADGQRRALMKEAEGKAKAIEYVAEAKAKAIKLESEASQKYFKDRAEAQRKLEVLEVVLKNNTKLVIPSDAGILKMLDLDSMLNGKVKK